MTTAVVKVNPGLDETVIHLQGEAERLVVYAEGFVVANLQGVKRATEDLSMIANLKKALEEKRKEYTQPLNDHLKEINTAFKVFSEPLDVADRALRGKILAFNAAQRRLQDEAARAEALRREAAEIEARLTQETGEIFLSNKPAVPVPEAAPVNKAYTEVGTMGTRKIRKWECKDFAQVPDEYKMLDGAKIGKVIRAGISAIAGIRIYEEDTIAITARKDKSAIESVDQE